MIKNLFIIVLFLSTFFKNVSGAIPLAEISLNNVREHILNYTPEQLIKLARGEKAVPQDISYEISKKLMSEYPTLFFPLPRIDTNSRKAEIEDHLIWTANGPPCFSITVTVYDEGGWSSNRCSLEKSPKYRNGKLSLQELAVVLLILNYKDFVKSNPEFRTTVDEVLKQIDVPAEQRHIKNFFEGFLNS